MIDLRIEQAFYGSTVVVENFSLSAEKGGRLCISGKSGIGKTTVLKILAGIHRQYRGSLEIPQSAHLAFVPQSSSLLPWKTVLRNTMVLKENRGPAETEAARDLLEKLGLAGYEKRYPGELSGGQRQRAALAQALFYEPDVLLLDEPFSALDNETKESVLALLKADFDAKGTTLILVSHTGYEADYLGCKGITLQ